MSNNTKGTKGVGAEFDAKEVVKLAEDTVSSGHCIAELWEAEVAEELYRLTRGLPAKQQEAVLRAAGYDSESDLHVAVFDGKVRAEKLRDDD